MTNDSYNNIKSLGTLNRPNRILEQNNLAYNLNKAASTMTDKDKVVHIQLQQKSRNGITSAAKASRKGNLLGLTSPDKA